jgi:hypothetical protein
MNKLQSLAAALLIVSTVAPQAVAQSTPAAQAARLQRLQAQQAAALARAKAAASAAAAAPTVTPPPIVTRPIPTVAATAPPAVTAPKVVATAAPKPTASAAANASAAPATSGSAAPVAAPAHPDTAAIALNIEALRKSRPDRRHAEFVDLQSRWGGLVSDPRAGIELKLHAQRIAYLQRIRALGAKDPVFVKGVDAVITKEETRDSDALNALRSGALPTTLPVAAAPVPAPAVVPPAVGASK